jgi:SPP1 gp7 family putative phage head morphogenesis protein
VTLQTDDAIQRSIQVQPRVNEGDPGGGVMDSLVIGLATAADEMVPWGRTPALRDRQLRDFWPTEPILASAVYSLAIRNAAFSWSLEGPELTVEAVQDMLVQADLGAGWQSFTSKLSVDVMTQDNGGFIETIRERDAPDAPVLGIAHLDSSRCTRTGNAEIPVIYQDLRGAYHQLKRHQVVTVAELPSPVESMRGMQLCAVSRVLRAAQYLRDIGVYQREKVGGNNPNAIHLVSGVPSQQITDSMQTHKDNQAAKGMQRFIIPLVLGSIDPSATVSVATIDLKTLPDGFDLDDSMRWYINQLALGFGVDYQDFAPLPGRGIGSSTEALVLHMKSRGKGPGFWMKMLEYTFNFHGLIPQNVTFSYDEQDVEADLEEAELKKIQADTIEALIMSGTLDPQAGRQLLLDSGSISEETFDRLSESGDATPAVTVQDVEPAENKSISPAALMKESHRARRRRMRQRPRKRSKAEEQPTDERADFAEVERLALEDEIVVAMDGVLARASARARAIMGLADVEAAKRAWFTAAILRRKQTPDDIIGDEIFWRAFRDDAVDTMAPFARQGVLEAVEANIAIGVGVDMQLVNQQVLEFTAAYTDEWWALLEGSSQAQLRTAISSWQQGGLGTRGFPDLVKAIESTFGRNRARRIAVTEATKIFDAGNKIAHEAGGINEEEWQTSRDDRVDGICSRLDEERFPINAGPRPVTGTHIGCRCARLPVGPGGETLGR